MESTEAAALISGMFLLTGALVAGIFAFFRYRTGPSQPAKGHRMGDDPAGTIAVDEWREMIKDDVAETVDSTLKSQLLAIQAELVGVRSLLTTISGSLDKMNGSIAQVLRDR